MNEDYLWDRSGPPDPEIAHLEETLKPFRHRPSQLQLQHAPPRASRQWVWWAAAAAAVLAAVTAGVRVANRPPEPVAWRIDGFTGAAQVGRKTAAVSMNVVRGDILRTGGDSQLRLVADDVGRVEIGANSELRASTSRQVMLNRGVLHAFIWAPAREFVVDTPSSRTVDLGCEYTLNVDASGDGVVQVQMGWVAFQYRDHEAFIPAGAQCVTRKSSGPGIPFYEDATAGLRTQLTRFEKGDASSLPGILAAARPRDGLTLWHVMTRASERDRGAVYDRLAQLVQLPKEATREGAVRRDPHTVDLCWNALNLENTDWWRGWKRTWAGQ